MTSARVSRLAFIADTRGILAKTGLVIYKVTPPFFSINYRSLARAYATRRDVPLRVMLTILLHSAIAEYLAIQSETLSVDRLNAYRVTLDVENVQKRAPCRFLARTMRFLLGAIPAGARRQ